jgi:hypothetical protein
MLKLRPVLLSLLVAWAGISASALPGQESPPLPTREAEQTMAAFSACMVRTANPQELRHFLRLVPNGPAFQLAGRRLARSYCVPRVAHGAMLLRFQPELFRSAVYSALYRRDFAASGPPDLTNIPPLLFSSEFDGAPENLPVATRVLRSLGDCTARADPRSVHTLLMTETGSSEEQLAMNEALPAVQHCLQEGTELRFGRGMLRGILAEALYKLRVAAGSPVRAGAPGSTGGE